VFVHGLNGDPKTTWTHGNGVFWPEKLLPDAVKRAQARILTYGYNANVYAFSKGTSASSDYLHQHAQTMVQSLVTDRYNADAEERPIIFVAHSLGGVLVKRVCTVPSANVVACAPRSAPP
jgi:hypothetical protein